MSDASSQYSLPRPNQSTAEIPSHNLQARSYLDGSSMASELGTTRQLSLAREQSPDFLQEANNVLEDIPNTDPDYQAFAADMAKFRDSVRDFRSSQTFNDPSGELESERGLQPPNRATSSGRGRGYSRGRRGGIRGPRKAAEPTGDIKLRLNQATDAYVHENYIEARDILFEIVRINAETYQAWVTLSSIFIELGQMNQAVMSKMISCQLQPKNVKGWLECASFIFRETGERWKEYIPSIANCYSNVLRADVKCLEARLGKAHLYLEKENFAGAISEYKAILKISPHNLDIVRSLAEAFIDNHEVENAKQLFKDTFDHFKALPNDAEQPIGWNEVDAYVTLYAHQNDYDNGIKELKRLSRWLLGRREDEFWDKLTSDDREWDEDNSRRLEVPSFLVEKFPLSTYGVGLPLELRVKMGFYRLEMGHTEEAMRHLDWLDKSSSSIISDLSDLYLEVGGKLLAAGLYQQSLSFYQALKKVPEQITASLYIQIGKCFRGNGLEFKAEECFHTAIQLEEANYEARIQLGHMYEALKEHETALIYVQEARLIQESQLLQALPVPTRAEKRSGAEFSSPYPPPEAPESSNRHSSFLNKNSRRYRPRRLADPVERVKEETARADKLKDHYHTLRKEQQGMRSGDATSTDLWIESAKELLDDFRAVRFFYASDPYLRFLGYSRDTHGQAEVPLDSELSAMADRISQRLGANNQDSNYALNSKADYRGIPFSEWLNIFIEYALYLAREGDMVLSYQICQAAADATVFINSREDMFLIHVAWCTCALLAGDEKTLVQVARSFVKDYQFTTDSYRMFSAVTRMCNSPVSWYCSSPTQKFMLRQIKAMDYTLADQDRRRKYFAEKASYTARDEEGNVIVNDTMDISLLMLYGHILCTGTSYPQALNYFFRAYALDPTNPIINLNIGLAYIHDALRKTTENRQHCILQGLTFLFVYYDDRKLSCNVEERQEAHYNMGRCYQLLGLPHLAIPYYSLVLEEASGVGEISSREDLNVETAYNLQTIYSASGNSTLAKHITERWLTI